MQHSIEQQETYTIGYGSGAMSWMKSRTLEQHGAFVLPWLRPNQRILDCACGPGTLTLDFAQRVPEGEVIGIDLESAQFAETQYYVQQEGIKNLTFQQADIYALPFEDNSFDLVFASAVLGNLNTPQAAVTEMVRVLRPGGVIALKEFDHGGDLIYPMTPVLEHSLELYMRIRAHNGHEVAGGRRLKEFLHEARCQEMSISSVCDTRATPETLSAYVDMNNRLQLEMLEPQYIALGWCQPGEVAEHAKAWEEFARDPRAISVSTWVQAIGRK